MKKIIIAEAKLVEAMSRSDLFFADDKERGLYINLDVASRAANALKPYVGQIVTISVEIPEQPICCSPDFEERALEIIRNFVCDFLSEKEVEAHIEWARRQMEK